MFENYLNCRDISIKLRDAAYGDHYRIIYIKFTTLLQNLLSK